MVSVAIPFRRVRRGIGLGAAALVSLAMASSAPAACANWNPVGRSDDANPRPIAAEDLIELAGIGRSDAEPIGDRSPLAVSPDGRHVAFILQRADIASNSYCQTLVVMALKVGATPRILDRGGDFIMTTIAVRGLLVANGFPQRVTPSWSPDGQSIGYLRRDHGTTQVWRVGVDGSPAHPITTAPVDVEAWAWAADGRRLVYATHPERLAVEQKTNDDGRAGWLYDDRITPNVGPRPQIPAPLPRVVTVLDLESGLLRIGASADSRMLSDENADSFSKYDTGAGGSRAWSERETASPLAAQRLHAIDSHGRRYACPSQTCSGRFDGMWWDPDGKTLSYLKREGWNDRFTALYRWAPGRERPRRVMQSDDLLEGCVPARAQLVCVRENAATPPHIVLVDPRRGTMRTLFDPNPGFVRLQLGSVERVVWRNALGLPVYGDLVLPRGYRRGKRLPTIVVQYHSRGFLRGGTGNEYPIYLLAARGFAVLSIERPPFFAAANPDLTTFDAINAANLKDWAERRNVQSAIEVGVQLLVSRGIADPKRIGITGLSDGASSARFALINSHIFAAASISSCCVDDSSAPLAGTAWADYSLRLGYPPAYPPAPRFWQPYSLALNADRMDTPLLMQLADSEYLFGLPTFAALRSYKQPVELYVFPDEFHIKWQPAHRRAIYERNLDWFSFWLQGQEDPALAKTAQYARWRAFRAARSHPDRAGPATAPGTSAP